MFFLREMFAIACSFNDLYLSQEMEMKSNQAQFFVTLNL